jgi:hypothetical protein
MSLRLWSISVSVTNRVNPLMSGMNSKPLVSIRLVSLLAMATAP